MANSGQLLAPNEVYRELEAGSDDDIFRWAKRHKFIFRDLDLEQFGLAQRIINDPKYKDSFDLDKETPEADPFVIALAIVEQRNISLFSAQIIVVSDENQATPGKKPKSPIFVQIQTIKLDAYTCWICLIVKAASSSKS